MESMPPRKSDFGNWIYHSASYLLYSLNIPYKEMHEEFLIFLILQASLGAKIQTRLPETKMETLKTVLKAIEIV